MIDAEPPSREAKLEVAPMLEGDAGAAEVARAVAAGETIGVAFGFVLMMVLDVALG